MTSRERRRQNATKFLARLRSAVRRPGPVLKTPKEMAPRVKRMQCGCGAYFEGKSATDVCEQCQSD